MSATGPLLVANGEVPPQYLLSTMSLLASGGSALDAVETVARLVEQDLTYRSAGQGGLPNLAGEVELDAMIMDGATMRLGAVGAVRRFAHPISIARKVMTELPHTFLAGGGAERFARECGFQQAELLTGESARRWQRELSEIGLSAHDVTKPQASLAAPARAAMAHRLRGDTMNAIACDSSGNLAVAVSTSGLALKYPGRIGDSPLAGAGAWADNRFGAAAATGVGELVVRSASSVRAVLYLELGLSVKEAGKRLLGELLRICAGTPPRVRLILVTPAGEATGFATWPEATVWALREGQGEPEIIRCHTPQTLGV